MTEATSTPAATAPAAPAGTETAAPQAAAPAAEATLLEGDASPAEQTADPAEKPAGEAAKPERAAPEKYEIALPEGSAIDPEILGAFEGVARELQMPQAEAQKVVETLAPVIAARVQQQQRDAIARVSDEWSTATKADPEIGGEKLAANLTVAKKALVAFGSPALSNLLNESRLGNHPEVIRLLAKAGAAISEDSVVIGRNAEPSRTVAQRLYPTMEK